MTRGRRPCREDVPLPRGAGDAEVTLIKGMDVFISVWNLHRSPECWENPEKFDPMRFKRPFTNPGVKDWAGYNPDLISGLYPNEAGEGLSLSCLFHYTTFEPQLACFFFSFATSKNRRVFTRPL